MTIPLIDANLVGSIATLNGTLSAFNFSNSFNTLNANLDGVIQTLGITNARLQSIDGNLQLINDAMRDASSVGFGTTLPDNMYQLYTEGVIINGTIGGITTELGVIAADVLQVAGRLAPAGHTISTDIGTQLGAIDTDVQTLVTATSGGLANIDLSIAPVTHNLYDGVEDLVTKLQLLITKLNATSTDPTTLLAAIKV